MSQNAHANDVETNVRRRMDEWRAAFEAKDVDAMMTFYEPGVFTAFDLMPPIEFRGDEQWRQNWIDFFAAFDGAPALEFAALEITATHDLAVVRLMCRLSGTMYGAALDMWVRQTNCFRPVLGDWMMFHDHVSVPTDFATGRSLVDLRPAV